MSAEVRTLDLEALVLEKGSHPVDGPQGPYCVMEAAAYIAGERHSDEPDCVSPVIGAFLRRWNDDLPDVERQRLKPYIVRVIGTSASEEVEEKRAWLVTDWMVRVHTPAWLELAGMKEQAAEVRALAPILSPAGARAAQQTIDSARSAAAAAMAAARDAAGAAAGDAAGDAAWAAAAARKALAPTVLDLQASAFQLLDALIEAK